MKRLDCRKLKLLEIALMLGAALGRGLIHKTHP